MTIASGHIQNKGKVRYPDFEHSCVGFASSWLRRKPKEMTIGSTYRYYFGNGYVKFSDGFAALNPQYFFHTKDHQGRSTSRKGGAFIAKRRKNVRSVVTKNHSTNEITEVQQTHYYPFGGIISDLSTGRDVQNRTYNAKEQDFANNLFWLDYGARQYDPTAPRFTTPDPLAEKYFSNNYFTYCMNNPVKFIDPDGRDIYLGEENRHELLLLLQSLTNDKLGVDKNGYVHIYDYNTKNKEHELKVGSSLIRHLINHEGLCNIATNDKNLFITHAEDYEGSKNPETGSWCSTVLIDLNGKKTFEESEWGESTVIKGNLILNIALGHELIHAYRDLTGCSLGNSFEEEDITTGIRGNYMFTENMLRKEQGKRKRIKY